IVDDSPGMANAGPGVHGPPACAVPTAPPGPVTATTVQTIEQAYRCVFDHYVGGSTVDDRVMLAGAFGGLVDEMGRRGLEVADAAGPVLTGDRDRDWAAFSAAYQRVTAQLPDHPAVREAVAAAAMNGMLGSLHDNHV